MEPDTTELMTSREVLATLRITKRTLTGLLRQNAFPNAFRLSRRLRIPRADIDAFKASRRIGGAK